MKIAFINIYQNIVDRGAEGFVKEIAGRLKENNQVDIYSLGNLISQEEARFQTPLNFLGKIRYKFFLDSHSLRVLKFTLSNLNPILKNQYDWVIPVDNGWELIVLKFCQILGLGKYKILVSGQAGIGRDDLRNLKLNPDIFVALTKRAKDWAEDINPKIKIEYIPNGVDLEKFNPKIESQDIALEKPIILCVAGLNPYKRVDLTIQAVSRLEKGSLLLLGDGPDRKKIDQLGLEKLGEKLGEKRYLRKTVSYEQMPNYYGSADLFTLVSESSEAFGTAYVEAMACNLPVVATDDEMRHEIIGEAGLFVDPENVDEYAKKLDEALKTKWGDKPREQSEKFSWDEIARKYEKLISSQIS